MSSTETRIKPSNFEGRPLHVSDIKTIGGAVLNAMIADLAYEKLEIGQYSRTKADKKQSVEVDKFAGVMEVELSERVDSLESWDIKTFIEITQHDPDIDDDFSYMVATQAVTDSVGTTHSREYTTGGQNNTLSLREIESKLRLARKIQKQAK